jgi:hypothetical protein
MKIKIKIGIFLYIFVVFATIYITILPIGAIWKMVCLTGIFLVLASAIELMDMKQSIIQLFLDIKATLESLLK